MSYGLYVANAYGNSQIDGTLPMYAGSVSYSFKCTQTIDNLSGIYKHSVPATGDWRVMLAISTPPAGVWVCVKPDQYSDSYVIYSTSSTVTHNLVIFESLANITPSSETHGLRAWAADGRLIFDSGHKLFSVDQKMYINSDGNKSISGGHTSHLMLPNIGQQRQITYSNYYLTYWHTAITSGSGVIKVSNQAYRKTYSQGGSYTSDRGAEFHMYRVNVR